MAQYIYELVRDLTSEAYPGAIRPTALGDFAQMLGWQPSYRLEVPAVSNLANAHLVVEHGLENTAVITFLRSPRRFADLGLEDRTALLNVSYNNLVDWHIHIQADEATFVFNRSSRAQVVERQALSADRLDALRSEAFEQIVGRRPTPNLPTLDDALVDTISFWKRNLAAEAPTASTEDLSALFNAIMFVRAAEDNWKRCHPALAGEGAEVLPTAEMWKRVGWEDLSLGELLHRRLDGLVEGGVPAGALNTERLRAFDSLARDTATYLLQDFYRNKYVPGYTYDFSLISKHALSRIYEHYVSILHLEESQQSALPIFRNLPEEERDKAYGSVYTPQFVARFFARYLREQMPPRLYRQMKTADPACGSGIFLRTLLELQCDPTDQGVRTDVVEAAFANAVGLDVDENACQAARLSLSLLYLVLTNRLPAHLDITASESIEYYLQHPELRESFDAVIANPPYVALGSQSITMRQRLAEFMEDHAEGRTDVYLAFLRMGLEMLRPGGFGCFVLPHSFLLGSSARKMRSMLADKGWIRCLADLSAIRVFQESQVYVILLIFQKKPAAWATAPPAVIVKCQDFVGRALEDAVVDRRVENKGYSIYDVDQDTFSREDWLVLPPAEARIRRRMERLPQIDEFLWVREGANSGADNVFIISAAQLPQVEEALFVPLLTDREMRSYVVPESTEKYIFYPYVGSHKVDEDQLRAEFPKTWRYLSSHRPELRGTGARAWWEPERPRRPENLLRPKIVTPHLSLVPRFGLDIEGRLAVSRSPFLYPRDVGREDELLRFFLAILNSTACYWHIAAHSHTYAKGYAMLEPRTLKSVPVPDPKDVAPGTRRKLLQLVDARLVSGGMSALTIERDIDRLVAELYGLSDEEYRIISGGE